MAAAAAQTFGRLFSSGAQRLGNLLAAAAPKPPTATTSAPAPTQAPPPLMSQTSITRPTLRQQVSVTESDSYPYPQTMKDSVPMNNYMQPHQDATPAISDMNDDGYGYTNNVSMDRDLIKQDSIDYNEQDEMEQHPDREYLRKQDSITDRGYLQNQNSLDSYTQDDLDVLNDVSSDYNKVHDRESPVSVIHVDRLEPTIEEEDIHSRGRGLENSLVEPYRPKQVSPPGSKYKRSLDEGTLPEHTAGLGNEALLLLDISGSPPPDKRAPQDMRGSFIEIKIE